MNAGVKFVMDCVLLGKSDVLQQVGRELDVLGCMFSLLCPFCWCLVVQILMQWLDTQ